MVHFGLNSLTVADFRVHRVRAAQGFASRSVPPLFTVDPGDRRYRRHVAIEMITLYKMRSVPRFRPLLYRSALVWYSVSGKRFQGSQSIL